MFFCLLVFVMSAVVSKGGVCTFLIAWLVWWLCVRHCVRSLKIWSLTEWQHAPETGAARSMCRSSDWHSTRHSSWHWLVVLIRAQWIPANGLRGSRWSQRSLIFFTDYPSHVLPSAHSDSFSKYDKKLFLYRLPTSALINKFKEVLVGEFCYLRTESG